MAYDKETDRPPAVPADLLKQFEQQIAGLGSRELREILQHLLDVGSANGDPFPQAPAPSRRRPRRKDVVTYRVRIDLKGTRPPLWRRLELASDLFLDQLHDIIQACFGWTDTHLHRFASGPSYYGAETEYYLCPFEVEEEEAGVPEEQVRLDEVLVDVGDKLFYTYDFGDDWEHVVKLEAVLPRTDATPRAVCTAGRRPGPPEDCGGVYAYEIIAASIDVSSSDHAERATEFTELFGTDVDPERFEFTPFDRDEINNWLSDLDLDSPR